LPGAGLAQGLVEVDNAAAFLAGYGALRNLPHGAALEFIGRGERKTARLIGAGSMHMVGVTPSTPAFWLVPLGAN